MALGLRLDGSQAEEATAGWDGGIYRAWSDGGDAAVVLSTEWDSEADAQEFAAAMRQWIFDGEDLGRVLEPDDTAVDVVFSTDAGALRRLETAVA
jgi:hypothetical protein